MFAFGLDHFVCLHFGPKKKLHLCYDKKKIGFGDDEFNDPSLQLFALWTYHFGPKNALLCFDKKKYDLGQK